MTDQDMETNTIFSPIGAAMGTSDDVPEQARIFELELKPTGSGLDIDYSFVRILESSATTWDGFKIQLLELLSSNSAARHKVNFHYPKGNLARSQVELSLRAPVETRDEFGTIIAKPVNRVFYVIILKFRGSEDVCKFRYTQSFDPFSYSHSDTPNNGSEKVFSNPHFIYDNEIEAGPGEELENPFCWRGETTRAGFMFNYAKAKSEIGEDFVLRFNMHCELATKQRGRPMKVREFLPIIIDPDVGHPGGNHGGPPGGGGG